MTFSRQDLVFAPDPFKVGTNPRPWVIVSDDEMPFPGDLLCVACTRSEYPMNYEVTADVFESGTKPDQATYCSPWLLATLKPAYSSSSKEPSQKRSRTKSPRT